MFFINISIKSNHQRHESAVKQKNEMSRILAQHLDKAYNMNNGLRHKACFPFFECKYMNIDNSNINTTVSVIKSSRLRS